MRALVMTVFSLMISLLAYSAGSRPALIIEHGSPHQCSKMLSTPGEAERFFFAREGRLSEPKMVAVKTSQSLPWMYEMNAKNERVKRLRSESDIEVELWHGFGAEYSHAGAMLNAERVFSDPDNGFRNRVRNRIKELGQSFVKVWATASDLPECGNGPSGWIDFPISVQYQRLVNYVLWRKSLAPRKPFVVIARSASAGLVLQLNAMYPLLIDGIILISPVMPGREAGWDESNLRLDSMIARRDIVPNVPAIQWIRSIYPQMTFQNDSQFARGARILALFGGKDHETPPETREWFERRKVAGSVEVEVFPELGHDLLAFSLSGPGRSGVAPQIDATPVYVRINQFHSELISHHKAAVTPSVIFH